MEGFDLLSLPVWVFSVRTLQIRASNRAAQVWLGYDASALHALTIADLRPVTDRDRIVERVRRFREMATDAGSWTIIARSGAHFVASFSWQRVTFDGEEAILASIRDMTQVTRAREEAKALTADLEQLRHQMMLTEEHFSRIFEAAPGKMMVLSAEGDVIVAATDEYAEAVRVEREAIVGRGLFDAFPDDPARTGTNGTRNLRASLQRVKALHATDVMNPERYPVKAPDGSFEERFWLPMNKPVFDRAGQLIYIIHRVEDVTDLIKPEGAATQSTGKTPRDGLDAVLPVADARAALLALHERETRLRTAELLLNLVSWEHDPERGTVSWSPLVHDMYGLSPDEMPADIHAYIALVHPEDRAEMVTIYKRFIQTGAAVLSFQHRLLREDGTILHVRGVGARHRIDGRDIVIGHVQDLTRLVEIEERLKEATRLQRMAGQMAKVGAWRIDLERDRVIWSPETAEIHGVSADFRPTNAQAADFFVPADRPRIWAACRACARQGVPFGETMQIVTADGRVLSVRVTGEPVRSANGTIIAIEGAFQDISELVEANERSENLSRRLLQTLESISDAFFLLDRDWSVSFLNGQAARLLQRDRDSLLGQNVWSAFPEAVGSTFELEYRRAVREQQTVRFKEYFEPLNTWFEVSAYPTPEGLAIYFRDITKTRARDQQLLLLEAAIARQNDIVLITEAEPIDAPDGPKIVYVNDAFVRRTGYTREEAIGRTPRFLQGANTQPEELQRIREALQAWTPVRAELINYTKAGEEFWIELDIVPIADKSGRFTHWVAIERDITERRRAEEAVRLSEARFRLITQAAGSAIWDWDVAGRQQWWSEGFFEIFGHRVDPEGAMPTVWRANVHPDDVARVDSALDRLLQGQADSVLERYRFRKAEGSWTTVEDRAFAVRDHDGAVVRVLGSMSDISERVLLEDRLRQSQKLEAVGQLTGGVAHDFNNLLTVIIGNAELLQDELVLGSRLRMNADMIAKAADRAADLTNRLLAFSRKQPLQPRILNVGDLVRDMQAMLQRTLGADIGIDCITPGDLWQTEVDPGQLETALLNLVINARDAMSGGGMLTIESRNVLLDDDYVSSEPTLVAGRYVMIAVSDTGQGIAPDMINRVFEPFFTNKEVGKGTGLGLSMVYGFVQQSGGHVRIYSELGHGTTVKLYFRAAAGEQPTAAMDPPSRPHGGMETILVVEDDPSLLQQVCAQLLSLGYRVHSAANGQSALQVLRDHPEIDLLFTDIVLPGGMNGRQIAEAAQAVRPDLKVLYTSGYSENVIIHHHRLDPGIELLSKPYRRAELASRIRKVLETRH